MKRTLLIISGSLVLLVVLFFTLLPSFVKRYVNQSGKELCGRNLVLDGVYHNPITGYTRFTGFQMLEREDTATFASFDTLVINLDLYKLLAGTFSISELRLVGPEININQVDTVYNFSDLIERFSQPESLPPDTTAEQGLNIELKNISLTHGLTTYRDLVSNREWHFDDIDVAIPGVYFDNQNTNVDLDLRLVDGGEILSNMAYNNQSGSYQVNLQLTEINLGAAREYIQDYLVISDFGANLDANLVINGQLGSPDQLTVTGLVDVNDYYFEDSKQLKFFSGRQVRVDIEELIPLKQKAILSSITIQDPSLVYEFYTDSTDNIRPLIRQDSTAEIGSRKDIDPSAQAEVDSSSANLDLLIRQVNIEGGQLDFRDHNPGSLFEYQFFEIAAVLADISPTTKSRLEVNAKAPDNGTLALEWEGNVFDLNQQAFTLKTNIPGLPAFSPYTISFFDAPIERGRFNYISTNHINNGQLEGLHTIMASDITLGKSTGFKSLYNVPLKIGLYLLEDKNGDIHLEVPVAGSVNDPNFRYSKIVVNAIINGIVKLITSPIALIGKLVGAGDDFKDIAYNPINVAITPDIETKLDYLVDAISEKPQLQFKMVQQFDPQQAGQDMGLYLVKHDYYLKTHENTGIVDFYMINNIDEKDPEFQQYLAEVTGREIENNKSIVEACYTLKETEILAALDTIPDSWNRQITAYLNQKTIPLESIHIEPGQNEQGKFEYQLEVELLDSQSQVPDSIASQE